MIYNVFTKYRRSNTLSRISWTLYSNVEYNLCMLSNRLQYKSMFLIICCIFLIASNYVYGSINRIIQFGYEMEYIRKLAVAYRSDIGVYPVTDNDSTWLVKMIEKDYMLEPGTDLIIRRITMKAGLPIDLYGNAIIYELPMGMSGDPMNQDSWPVLRSLGKNGVDNKGGWDDWDVRFGPNIGFWYKKGWPWGMFVGIILVIATLIFIHLLKTRIRKWALTATGFGMALALGTIVADPSIGMRSCPLPDILFYNVPGGFALIALGVGVYLYDILLKMLVHDRRISKWQCPECGYDLRSLQIEGCPECGWKRKSAE